MKTSAEIVNSYLNDEDWRVKENSNNIKSIGSLGKYIIGEVGKDYWLREVYNPKNPEIAKAHISGYIHIHDLSGVPTLYCCGYSLREILEKGVKGVSNIPVSAPAKHFMSALNQLVNLTSIFQNEIMGAVAFSNVDTLLAPYIKKDNLTFEEVKQHLQNFIYSINSNSRAGAEPAFSNITLDLTPDTGMLNKKAKIAGEEQEFTYKDCQPEIDMFNRAFCEIMIAGDASGKSFPYPIPTYNIHKRFDWDNPNNELLWEMTGKYGIPYFANFINSDMDPEEARSMCCRLRLDMRELSKRYGGLFGSGDSTGSIGVVTINLPRLAFESSVKSEESGVDKYKLFYSKLDKYMDLAKESLLIKRDYIQTEILDKHMLPAFEEYVGTLNNHFNTIGLIGMNEMCLNLLGVDIKDIEGHKFSLEVLDHMRNKLSDYQEETRQLFNLEATPAESTSYRLAKLDTDEYGDLIITQGPIDAPYYTNSCHLAVKDVESIKELFDYQNDLQTKFTGGTVIHCYLEGPITGKQAKQIIRTVMNDYSAPYVSLSPLNAICPEHGLLMRSYKECPICGKETDLYQRITGYIRNVKNFNPGKKSEFLDRKQIKL